MAETGEHAVIRIDDSVSLDEAEFVISFMRASGPGGQNVNKVSTACELRFDARRSPSLPADIAVRLMRLAGSKATKDGVIIIAADRFRSQEMNRRDAIERLVDLVRQAAIRPKKRLKTKPTFSATQKRLEGKSIRATVKKTRSNRDFGD
jgi:ribosome-associated protein